ncbi:GTP cyclohydrolase FolE2 [Hydromonas duriensis]|uniref:GTP cyclohydrolase FolE2 n=1 Tax=Hydromonas duriensis TaxID=1527608 RepID=A0A4R6Y4M0_9BURK|nr:GTP cyclohydrolase FolE2 [Hydromonas duriensis]TDR28834.1 GTP cyclohydrolase I [Hydromonas duriensis]
MNSPTDLKNIPDVQSSVDARNMPISRVGIKDVRFPLQIDLGAGAQATVASYTMCVFLPADQKGTHMSRFVALLEENKNVFTLSSFKSLIDDMMVRLESQKGDIQVQFPYFVEKTAPISGIKSLMDYQITLNGTHQHGQSQVALSVLIPMTSLCPCSKKISEYGAHNQRSHVTAHMTFADANMAQFDLHALIAQIEAQGSCELYGLLKRPDEKYVTERAYDNPKFVEDLVRDVAGVLKSQDYVAQFTVEAENFESIHNHSAYAVIQSVDI